MRNVQLLPTGVHVSVAYPPDTNTPGYANENTTKACIVPDTPPVLSTTGSSYMRYIAESITCPVLSCADFTSPIFWVCVGDTLAYSLGKLVQRWQLRSDRSLLGFCSLRCAMQSAGQPEMSSTPRSRCCARPVDPGKSLMHKV